MAGDQSRYIQAEGRLVAGVRRKLLLLNGRGILQVFRGANDKLFNLRFLISD